MIAQVLFLLLLIVTLTAPVSAHEDHAPTDTREPIPLAVLKAAETSDPLADLSTRLVVDDGVRNYPNIQRWFSCYPNCTICEDGVPRENVITGMAPVCLPSGSDQNIVFDQSLPGVIRRARDERICQCFADGNAAAIENYSYQEGPNSISLRGRIRERIRASSSAETNRRIIHELSEERYLTAFSAMTFAADARESSELGARYAAGVTPRGGIFSRASRELQEVMQRPLDQSILMGTNLPPDFCIDYRSYLSSKQFPNDVNLIDDISGMSEWRDQDWDYNHLFRRFREIAGENRTAGFEELVRSHPEASRIHRRMKFLYNNPAIRNVFLSSKGRDEKRQLFRLLKAMPRTNCGGVDCSDNPQWQESLRNYKEGLRNFFRQTEVMNVASNGVEQHIRLQTELTEDEALHDSVTVDNMPPEDDFRSDASVWRRFCQVRTQFRVPPAANILRELEEEFGTRHPTHPAEDGEFAELNEAVCTQPRKNASGQAMTFSAFLQGRCESPCPLERKFSLVSSFLRAYPLSDHSKDLAKLVLPFLEGEAAAVVRLGQSDAQNATAIASNPRLARSEITYIPSDDRLSEEGPRSTVAQANSAARAPASQNETTPGSPQQQLPPFFGGTPPAAPEQLIFQPLRPDSQRSETREALAQGEAEATSLNREISSLRETLRSSGEQRASAEIRAATQRLDDLMKRLADVERENASLRRRAPEEERPAVAESPRTVRATPTEIPERRTVAAPAQTPIAQGGASSGATTSFVGGGSPSAPLPSPRDAQSAIRNSAAAQTGARRETFGITETASVNGITVATSTLTINYDKLREQSEQSEIRLPVSPEEFNQIKDDQRALARYFDRVRAIPGDVVRVSIVSNNETLVLYLVKDGDVIICEPQDARVSRGPASVEPADRARLQRLKEELEGRN